MKDSAAAPPHILAHQIYIGYLDIEDVKMVDIEAAHDAGMIRKKDLEHHGIYAGYSPRNITVATWDFYKQCFYLRVVSSGDSKFIETFHPIDEMEGVNMFVPTAVLRRGEQEA